MENPALPFIQFPTAHSPHESLALDPRPTSKRGSRPYAHSLAHASRSSLAIHSSSLASDFLTADFSAAGMSSSVGVRLRTSSVVIGAIVDEQLLIPASHRRSESFGGDKFRVERINSKGGVVVVAFFFKVKVKNDAT